MNYDIASARSTASKIALAIPSVLLVIGLTVPRPVYGELLLNHVIIGILILYWVVQSIARRRLEASRLDRDSIGLVLVVLVCTSLALVTFGPANMTFSELAKIVLALLGSVAIASAVGPRLRDLVPVACLLMGASAVITLLVSGEARGAGGTYVGRFMLDGFGSPNALATLSALLIIILLFAPSPSFFPRTYVVLKWAMIAFLLFATLASSSRGGLLALVVGVVAAAFLPKTQREARVRRNQILGLLVVLALGFAIAAISGLLPKLFERLNPAEGDPTTGRFAIWMNLLELQAQSLPAMVYGFGPGTVHLPIFNKIVVSAHSIPLTMLFYFGALGFAAFVVLMVRRWLHALRVADEWARLRLGVLACITFSFAVDAVLISSQLILALALALAVTSSDAVIVGGPGRGAPLPAQLSGPSDSVES